MTSITIKQTPSSLVLTTGDPRLWHSYLSARQSVYGSVEFSSIAEQHLGYSARLFVFIEGENFVVYPFFLRPVSELPFSDDARIKAWDSMSPEYTGPLALGTLTQDTVKGFRECFAEYCRQEQIVTEFAHLHPWRWSADLLVKENVFLDREIVYVDLTWPEELIWRDSFTAACRKNISRARKDNVRVFQATALEDVEQFYRIYIQTMDRRQALAKYYFPLSYFIAFFQQMPDNALFLLAECENQVIAATLYLHDDNDVYSYLGGADQTFQHVRPTNAIVYEAIRWAQRRGKKRLIMGGGYHPDDGIFRFKASFSPLRYRFHVYKHIHLPEKYAALCDGWAAHNLGGYFPTYRIPPSLLTVEKSNGRAHSE
jgi:serine/alanine adding enzyme